MTPLRPAPTSATFGSTAATQPYFAPAPQSAAKAPAHKAPATGGIARLLPEVVRDKLSDQARRFRGFPLLTVLLGQDPISGRTVPRTAPALVRGVLALTPDGEQRYQQLAQSGVLGQVAAWLTAQAERRHLSWARVSQLLHQAWHDFSLTDFLLHPIDTVTHLVQPFRQLAADVLGFAGAVAGQVVELVFSAVLGEKGAEVLAVLRRAGNLFGAILRDPLPFLQHLVQAGWQGFKNFLAHGPQHLLAAAKDWLLGGLAKTGLQLPARLDVAGVISLLLQVFNLTKQAILGRLRQRLVQVIGAENVARVEDVVAQIGGVAVALWQHGPAAAWQQISQQAGDLKDQALGMVKDQVLGVAARAVPVFLATLAVPGGAFVQAAKGIYSAVMLFVEKGKQIAQVGAALLNSVGLIAAGQLGPAAQAVETTLVRILPVALGFLAKWLNLDGISGAIQAGLKKVQAPVERAVTKVLDVVTDKAKVLWAKLQAGTGTVVDKGKAVATTVGNTVRSWLNVHETFETENGESHELYTLDKQGETQLIRASADPQDVVGFLTRLLADEQQANAGVQTIKEKRIHAAIAKATEIKGLITRTARALNRLNPPAAGSSGVVNTDPAQEGTIVTQVHVLALMLRKLVPEAYKDGAIPALVTLPAPLTTPISFHQGNRQQVEMHYLTRDRAKGGADAKGEGLPEMDYVLNPRNRKAGLVNGQWVRMHLITAAVGGKGDFTNWVPAPSNINTGDAILHSFEHSAEDLVRVEKMTAGRKRPEVVGPARRKFTVLWAHVLVNDYYKPTALEDVQPDGTRLPKTYTGFAQTITFTYGLHVPTGAGNTWERVPTPLSKQVVHLPLPNDKTVYLNQATKTDIRQGAKNTVLTNPRYGSKLREYIAEAKGSYSTITGEDVPTSLEFQLRKRMATSRVPEFKDIALRDQIIAEVLRVVRQNPFALELSYSITP